MSTPMPLLFRSQTPCDLVVRSALTPQTRSAAAVAVVAVRRFSRERVAAVLALIDGRGSVARPARDGLAGRRQLQRRHQLAREEAAERGMSGQLRRQLEVLILENQFAERRSAVGHQAG